MKGVWVYWTRVQGWEGGDLGSCTAGKCSPQRLGSEEGQIRSQGPGTSRKIRDVRIQDSTESWPVPALIYALSFSEEGRGRVLIYWKREPPPLPMDPPVHLGNISGGKAKCCPECSLFPNPLFPSHKEPILRPPGLHSPPQTFTDAGGITSSFTLGKRRAGVKVADQRGPGPGTALAYRIMEAG